MRWAALVAWLLTAGGGSVLLNLWIRHGGPRQVEGVRSRHLFPHVALALAGLTIWLAFLVWDESWLAWLAVGLLLVIAAIGLAMLAISWRGRTRVEHTAVVAEVSFPAPVVVLHGALATVTLVLAVLAAAGVG